MPSDRSQELPRIPELEDEYELVRELGRGGTAVVYLARDRQLGRDVAIKLIRPSHVRDEEALARLVREARTVGQLQHPNIVMLLGTQKLSEGGLALILQFVPGRTLKERIREEGPLSFAEAERILRDLGQALAYAHRRRIVHRDIKPENVYLDDDAGVARLADFGIARAWDSDSGLTMPGTAIGTPSYMSPEQVDGKELDGRSDIYSLGLLGWEILTGRQPWAGESLYSVIYKQKQEELPRLGEVRLGAPANLERTISRALEKDPDRRWEDAEAFLESLARGSTLPPAVATSSERPDDFSWHSPSGEPDAQTIQYVRPDGDPVDNPGVLTHREPTPDDTRRVLDELRAELEAPGQQPRSTGSPVPGEPTPPPRGPGAGRGTLSGTARDRREQKARRLGFWTAAALIVLLAGGVGTAAILEGPDGSVRSLLGQILPSAGTDGSMGAGEAYEAGRPPAVEDAPDATSPGMQPATDPSEADLGPEELPTDLIQQIRQVDIARQEGLEAFAGGTLPEPVVVRVEGEGGEALAGIPLLFTTSPGGGSPSPTRAVTGADGTATTTWTLGASPGTQELQVLVDGAGEVAARVTARALPRTPSMIQAISGAGQDGTAGRELSGPLEVRVLDTEGRGVAERWVRFTVVEGGGSVSPDSARTDGQGIARTRWTLGPVAGQQVVRATLPEMDGLATTIEAAASVPGLAVRATMVAGGTHSCLLAPSGSLRCWGDNGQGQLGEGTAARRSGPGPAVTGGPYSRVTSGLAHTCSLNAEGRAFCWGANDRGQLGDGTTTRRREPTPVAGSTTFVEIQAGASHTCALTRDGRILCWGANSEGQLGDGTSQSRMSPTPVDSDVTFRSIAVGWRHSCALAAGGLAHCWGSNTSGELGRSAAGPFPSPMPVAGRHTFTEIAAGNAHACGLTPQGQVLCWGDNQSGQLGDGTTEGRRVPTPVESTVTFTTITAGALHTCGVAASGAAHCWGRNLYGQVGTGDDSDQMRPVEIEGAYRFQQVSAFGSHTCGRTPGGDVLCWGYNADGQLGDGSRTNRNAPVPVGGG